MRVKPCPFCRHPQPKKLSEIMFSGTTHGPVVRCFACGAEGPVALGIHNIQVGPDTDKLRMHAVGAWNIREKT